MGVHLVTGGNGFLGEFIVRELLKRGKRVRVLDVIDDPNRDPRSELHLVDVLDREALRGSLAGVDYVHHNAALVPLKKAGNRFWQVNVEGTRNVLEAAKEAGVKHFSHMSSSAVYGAINDEDCPINDRTPRRPVEIYGRSKLAGEQIVEAEMKQQGGLSCSIIRPRTIIGTERLGIFQILFEWISEGRNIYIIGAGSNLFQFAHVDDVVTVSVASALQQKSGIFNVGTDQYRTLREDLGELCKIADTGSRVKSIPVWFAVTALKILDRLRLSPLAPWHYLTYHKPFYFDISNTMKDLGWKPKHSNIDMLTSSYQWYLQNRERLARDEAASTSAHRSLLKQRALRVLKKLS